MRQAGWGGPVSEAGRVVAAVLRASGLDVRVARRDPRKPGGEIVASNPRRPCWGTVVIDPGILARWWDWWVLVDDESAAVVVAAAIICWMGSQPGIPAEHPGRLRILPPPEEFPDDQEAGRESVIGWPALAPRHRDSSDALVDSGPDRPRLSHEKRGDEGVCK